MTPEGLYYQFEILIEKLGSQAEVARLFHISKPYVNDIVQRRRPISESLARKMGYRKVVKLVKTVTYERV